MATYNWTTEEMILAASVADRLEWGPVNSTREEVQELSRLLRNATFHPGASRDKKFRSVNSVGLKINNLRASHPSQKGKGLRVSKGEISIVEAFVANPSAMRRVAYRILEAVRLCNEKNGLAEQMLLNEITRSGKVG